MAWIESHQEIEKHPKMLDLCSKMRWDLDTAIGKLHRFWWWCVDYAEDGDLRRHNDDRLGGSVGLNGEEAKRFVVAMVESCWIDRKPYLRVHDWWDYIGRFLMSKYSHNEARWRAVREAYRKPYAMQGIPNLTKPKPKPREEKETPRARELPDWLIGEIWEKYREHRKKMGKPLTAYAEERALVKLGKLRDRGQNVEAVIEQSIDGPWLGLFQVKPNSMGGTGIPVKTEQQREKVKQMLEQKLT